LAVLTKQSLIAPSIAGAVWLWSRDRRAAFAFSALATALVLGVSLVFEVSTHAYIANTVLANANPISLGAFRQNLVTLLLYQAGPAAAAIWLFANRRSNGHSQLDLGPLPAFFLATCLPLLGLAKVGSNHNYWIDMAAASSALAAGAVWYSVDCVASRERRTHRFPTMALALSPALWLNAAVMVFVAMHRPDHRLWPTASESQRREFGELVERVRSAPGVVLTDPMDVQALAGRPVYLEPYLFSILSQEGQWDARLVIDQICSGSVGAFVADRPLDAEDISYHGYEHWPPVVRDALRSTMVLDAQLAGRYLYVPAPSDRHDRCG
jgi:hypothetical protein